VFIECNPSEAVVARSLFGVRSGDVVSLPPSSNGGFIKVAAGLSTGTAWTALTGGTQITDLLTFAGAATSFLFSDADGYLVLTFGPDPLNYFYADFGGGRRLIESQTFAADLATAAKNAAITAAAADATAKANAAQANAIAATAGFGPTYVQNSDGTFPDRRLITSDRTIRLFAQLVRTDIVPVTAAVTATTLPGVALPCVTDFFFYSA
jgi:crotonobetainyl-CoA:carnitine CoA-transferase CaiB-like acyl-CoA transferase